MPNVVSAAGRAEPTYPIASVGNALRLLLLFRERKAIRLSDASDYLGVANSTAHRLLAMLVHREFVEQEPGQRTYIAGPALVEIGLAAVRGMDLRTSARPVLECSNRMRRQPPTADRPRPRRRHSGALVSTSCNLVAFRTCRR